MQINLIIHHMLQKLSVMKIMFHVIKQIFIAQLSYFFTNCIYILMSLMIGIIIHFIVCSWMILLFDGWSVLVVDHHHAGTMTEDCIGQLLIIFFFFFF
jgi:hypothetical protein